MSEPLTTIEARTLAIIRRTIETRGSPPTLQELAWHFQTCKVTAFDRVGRLVRKGWLTKAPGRKQGLQLVDDPARRLARLVLERLAGDAGAVALAQAVLGEGRT